MKVFEIAWACFVGNITASSMVNTVDEITHLRSVGNQQDLGVHSDVSLTLVPLF